ncbi:BrnA antitoxin family protein [Polymorphobacter sp. PAMC 29334]|nr:BrnA antitoxin family protein [Polymorphobacter sp. PAMC 29334]
MATNSEAASSAKSQGNAGRRSSPAAASASASSQSDAPATTKPASISVEEFDRKFDDGEDISEYLDFTTTRRPGLDPKRVNVDFPSWMVFSLDREAKKRGVTRQALIKMWLADRLEAAK